MRLLDRLTGSRPTTPVGVARSWSQGWESFLFDGNRYIVSNIAGSDPERVDGTFKQMVERVYERNGPVAAAVVARMHPLSQVRFQWRRSLGSNRAGELWGNQDLAVLERPGPTTRSELLVRAEQDVSLGGTAFFVRARQTRDQIRRLSPDRVTFLFGSNSDPTYNESSETIPWDADLIGIVYNKAQYPSQGDPADLTVFRPGEFAVWRPEPDPLRWWRGSSWVCSVLREVGVDSQVVDHETQYFKSAATPRLVFMMDKTLDAPEIEAFAELSKSLTQGTDNAYRNYYLGGGVDKVEVVGTSMKDLGTELLSGKMETRISQRSRVPGSYLGIAVSYGGSTLNTGNFGSARRTFVDGFFTPVVDNLCESMEAIVPPPSGSEMGYDPSRVQIMQEDEKDAAEITRINANAAATAMREGWAADAVVEFVDTGDIRKLLGQHSGLVSVQMQPADGTQENARPIIAQMAATDALELVAAGRALPLPASNGGDPE